MRRIGTEDVLNIYSGIGVREPEGYEIEGDTYVIPLPGGDTLYVLIDFFYREFFSAAFDINNRPSRTKIEYQSTNANMPFTVLAYVAWAIRDWVDKNPGSIGIFGATSEGGDDKRSRIYMKAIAGHGGAVYHLGNFDGNSQPLYAAAESPLTDQKVAEIKQMITMMWPRFKAV